METQLQTPSKLALWLWICDGIWANGFEMAGDEVLRTKGWSTLSHKEARCLAVPKLQEVTETLSSPN